MAERGRFELPEPVKVQRFSRPPQSTTLPPLRDDYFSMYDWISEGCNFEPYLPILEADTGDRLVYHW
jgi:hypothetical protein